MPVWVGGAKPNGPGQAYRSTPAPGRLTDPGFSVDFGGLVGGGAGPATGGASTGGGAPKPTTSKPPSIDFEKLASQFLGAPGGAAGGAAGKPGGNAGGAGSMVNTAQEDPRLKALADTTLQRVTNPDMSTRRAIDAAGLAIRDLASGQEKEAQVGAAMRGVSGSGMESAALGDIQQDTRGRVAGAARDITLARERDQDQFLLGASNPLGAVGEANREDRALNQQAWIENEQNIRAQRESDLSRQIAILNLLSNLAG